MQSQMSIFKKPFNANLVFIAVLSDVCYNVKTGDTLSSETWEIRDLMSYGLTNAEKYMVLAFECGLAM